MREAIKGILLTEEQIAAKVREMGAEISRDYEGKAPLVVSVLKGSFIFMADLVRHITVPCTVDFMAVSSYGAGVKSSGEVQVIKDLNAVAQGRHILIVEDILDSGITLSYIMKVLKARGPASLELVALLDKPERRKVQTEVRYKGFTVPDEFVVGYGLDYNEKFRNLPYIGILKPEIYGAAPGVTANGGLPE